MPFNLSEFRGPPDPLRGDQIYQKVRDAARVIFFFNKFYLYEDLKY
jgi:hypothetical protein